ncbi:MAG: dolichol kinase [Cognaticolwellia sp.]|jgi:dolichol kinase
MSFFRSLFLAIFATLFLTYVLGVSFIDLFDVNIYMGEQMVEPLKAISISALVVVLLVLVALAIAMSVFGSLIFIVMLLLGGGAMLLVGVFWPIFLVAGVIWLVTRDESSVQY